MKLNSSRGISTLHQWSLLLFTALAFVLPAQGQGNKPLNIKSDYLLVINAYTSDAPWSNALIEPVQKWVSAEQGVALFVEHLNMLMISDIRAIRQGKAGYSEQIFRQSSESRNAVGQPFPAAKRRHPGTLGRPACDPVCGRRLFRPGLGLYRKTSDSGRGARAALDVGGSIQYDGFANQNVPEGRYRIVETDGSRREKGTADWRRPLYQPATQLRYRAPDG